MVTKCVSFSKIGEEYNDIQSIILGDVEYINADYIGNETETILFPLN